MKFDEILYTYLGEFGKYQKIQFFLVCLPTLFTAMHALSWTFTSAIPPHRCRFPDENSSVPFKLDEITWKNLTPPFGLYERRCSRYKGLTVYGDDEQDDYGEEESCKDGYVFDLSDLKNTAISRWNIVCDNAWIRAVVQSMYYVGQFFGSLVFGVLGDKYGRKIVFFIAIILQIVCGTIMAFVPYWPIFGLLRIGLGFSHPGIFVIAVVIGSELVGPSKRRFAGVCTGICFTFGQVIMGLLAWGLKDYQYIQLAISLPALVFVVYWWIVPESARWLVSMKRFAQADKILQKAAKVNKVQLPPNWHEEVEIETDEKNPQVELAQKKYGILDLFRYPQIRKRALICWFCWPVVSMVYYGLSMNPSFLGGNIYVVFIVAGAMEIPGLVFVFFAVDRLGRKALCSGGYFIAALCLFSTLIIPKEIVWLNVIQIMLSKTAITATYAVVYTYTPELFPTPIRNTTMGLCSMIARVGAISASYISMWLVVKSKLAVVLLFASFALTASFLALFLPETAGHPLPETFEDVEDHATNKDPIFSCFKRKAAQNQLDGEAKELEAMA